MPIYIHIYEYKALEFATNKAFMIGKISNTEAGY